MGTFKENLLSIDHIKERCKNNNKYVDDLLLVVGDDIETQKYILNKLKQKLNESQYLQAVTEIVFWLYLKRYKYKVQADKRINANNSKDVDICATSICCKLNIEIKTPTIELCKDNVFLGRPLQTYKNPSIQDSIINDANVLKELFEKQGRATNIRMPLDNKLFAYVEDANDKFDRSFSMKDNQCNILAMGLVTDAFANMLQYISNSDSGLLSKNPLIDESKFNKIDFIVLTNTTMGHALLTASGLALLFNVWKLDNYICFGIPLKKDTATISKIGGYEFMGLFGYEYVRFGILARDYMKTNECSISMHDPFLVYLKEIKPVFFNKDGTKYI